MAATSRRRNYRLFEYLVSNMSDAELRTMHECVLDEIDYRKGRGFEDSAPESDERPELEERESTRERDTRRRVPAHSDVPAAPPPPGLVRRPRRA